MANQNAALEFESDLIEIGKVATCVGGAIVHPLNFHLNLLKNWNTLEDLQRKFQ